MHEISCSIVSCPAEVAEFDLEKYDKEVKIDMPMETETPENAGVSNSQGGYFNINRKVPYSRLRNIFSYN